MVSRLTLLSLFSLCMSSAWAAVLAIDYGTDWTKASLMKPGVPFDVLLNRDSKRKIHASVGWNREDRLFSTDAFNIATRFPQDSFPSLKHIVGSQFSSNKKWYYSQIGQGIMLETNRGTIELERPNAAKDKWTVEELIGMQLAYIRALAEETAGERVTDLVLTVPAFFSHFERQALLDAVEIAGLRTLALLNDGSAVAVNYAMTRSFPEKEHHIIYDAGAGSIRATVASFYSPDASPSPSASAKKSKSKNPTKESANIEVLGYGWNTRASGNELTRRLRDRFVGEFERKHGHSLSNDGRALARIWKEAERAKGILSANADSRSMVESLANDIDFKTATSRADFEASCEDLKMLYGQPIVDALESSGLGWENITSVILMGGHSRVPMVQAAVKALAGDSKISQNINTDEAAVLGSAFYGASLSRQFRTKKIKLQDISTHDLQVSYEADGKNGKRTINTLIFPKFSKTGVKKTLSFKRKEDFNVRFSYKVAKSTPDFPQDILDMEISNVTEAVANLTSRGAVEPTVKLTLLLSDSGLITVSDAVAFGEVKDDSFAGKLKGFFGGGSSSASSTETTTASESGSTPVSATSSSSAAKASETPVTDAKKDEKNRVPVVVNTKYLNIRPLTSLEKTKSRTRLIAVDMAEKAIEEKAEAINQLEAYIYRIRDLLIEAETTETQFKEFSSEEERAKFRTLLEETSEWMLDAGSDSSIEVLKSKRRALENLEAPIQARAREFDAIPAAVKDLNSALDASRIFLGKAKAEIKPATPAAPAQDTAAQEPLDPSAPPAPSPEEAPAPRFTEAELEEVNEMIEETQTWLKEKLESVAGKPKNIDVPFRAIDLDQKGFALQKRVKALEKRKVPAKPKKKATTSTSSSSTATSSTASSEETKRDEL